MGIEKTQQSWLFFLCDHYGSRIFYHHIRCSFFISKQIRCSRFYQEKLIYPPSQQERRSTKSTMHLNLNKMALSSLGEPRLNFGYLRSIVIKGKVAWDIASLGNPVGCQRAHRKLLSRPVTIFFIISLFAFSTHKKNMSA